MKNKERKNVAKQLAALEEKLAKTTDLREKELIEREVILICSKIQSMEDMIVIDEMVQSMLKTL